MAGATEPKQCPILTLPPELRNRIYELVLIENTRIDTYTWNQRPTKEHLRGNSRVDFLEYRSEPALVQTCTTIREEGLPVFYGSNIFESILNKQTVWQYWLSNLRPEKSKMIRHLRVDNGSFDCQSVEEAFRMLSDAHAYIEEQHIKVETDALYVVVRLEEHHRRFWTNKPLEYEQEGYEKYQYDAGARRGGQW